MRRATARVFPCLLDCIKRAQPRVAGGSKNHVDAFADLRQRDFLSFTRIVPRRVSDADVVLNDFNIRFAAFAPFSYPPSNRLINSMSMPPMKTIVPVLEVIPASQPTRLGPSIFL